MKESIIVYGLKNVVGGTENYLLAMQEQLHNRYRFDFIIEKCDCIHESKIKKNDGCISYISGKKPLKKFYKDLGEILRRKKQYSSILYINVNDITIEVLCCLIIGKIYRYKIITHSHNALQTPIDSLYARLRHSIVERIGRKLMNQHKIVRLAVSERAGMYLYKKNNFKTVSPGIDAKKFIPNPIERNEMKAKLLINQKKIIGFVGRLVEVKNPIFVLEVFSEIVKIQDNVCLIIVGDGLLLDEMKAFTVKQGIQNKVLFIGESNEVNKYLQCFDIMLSPSLSEGLSLSALEAQASGIPIICAEGNFPPEVKIGPLIHFISLGDKKGWIKRSLELLDKDNFSERMVWYQIFCSSKYELRNAVGGLKEIFETK